MTDPSVTAQIQGWFTLGAAGVAALAATLAAVLTAVSGWRARQWTGREQWWTRFSWAIEMAVSTQPTESELGLSVLLSLVDVPWARREDNEMALAVADLVIGRNEEGDAGDE